MHGSLERAFEVLNFNIVRRSQMARLSDLEHHLGRYQLRRKTARSQVQVDLQRRLLRVLHLIIAAVWSSWSRL